MQESSSRVQFGIAQRLVETRSEASLLVRLLESGVASPSLLKNDALRTSLLTVLPSTESRRVDAVVATFADETTDRAALLEERRRGFLAATDLSTEAGRAVFEKNCAPCHRLQLRGNLVGPNLVRIGNRGLERLFEDVLDPNRNVDPEFQTRVYLLNDGRVVSGLYRRKERGRVVVSDTQGKEMSISSQAILSEEKSRISIMPNDWAECLAVNALYQLIAYLRAQGVKSGTD